MPAPALPLDVALLNLVYELGEIAAHGEAVRPRLFDPEHEPQQRATGAAHAMSDQREPHANSATGGSPTGAGAAHAVVGEARWPMASAVVAAMVLTIFLPEAVHLGPRWLLPLIEGALLAAVIAADPGRINRRTRRLRGLSIVLVSVLVVGALWATAQLIGDLIHGGPETNSASELLAAGTIVWLYNNIAFALLYWELDGGGAAARAQRLPHHGDFAFPQQLNPRVAAPNWRPQFVDYLYLGFTNATAFSPTDAMPLAPWAKLAMMVQSLVSMAILALVIARAVNVFT